MADITIDPTLVIPSSSAVIASGIAGATITAGKALYIDTADSNKLKLADADAASPACDFAGIALGGATAGQKVFYCTEDTGGLALGGTGTAAGDDVWLSETAGGLTETRSEIVSGAKVTHVGIMISATLLKMKPLAGGTIA